MDYTRSGNRYFNSTQPHRLYWTAEPSLVLSPDYLEFYIDGTRQDRISGEVDWTQKSYAVDSGIHILKWRFIKNSSGSSGDNCGWVDFVQWTGPSPTQDPANWQEIAYKQDVAGRRVEKKVDGYSTRYVYNGDHVIAEYDGNNNLLRKYVYGPGIDQPVSMIEVADSNATYYYHFDALGSVVALSNASGNTVQTYEYSVYGEVAVEDANHPNPYMFAGVRYDIEIGLYYNRARYYDPFTGRFLQTDPIGYDDGMNWYAYCKNNPLTLADPSGKSSEPTAEELLDMYEQWDSGGFSEDPFWRLLIGWYLVGNGKPLLFYSDFVLSDSAVRAQVTNQIMDLAREYWSKHKDGIFPIKESFSVGFSEQLGLDFNMTRFLLGGATLWMIGDVNVCGNRVTITAKYVLADWMNLHPDRGGWQHVPDQIGAIVEQVVNRTAASIGSSHKAQPYPLFIESSTQTTTFTFNDSGQCLSHEGWPFSGP